MITQTLQPARLLPLRLMARQLRVPAGWLRDEAEAGRVPCLRAGTQFLFNPVVLERLLLVRAAGNAGSSAELQATFNA